MKNLRIVKVSRRVDNPYLGITEYTKYLVCKDFERKEFAYTKELKERGEVIEEFNTEENATLFMWALTQNNSKNVV